MSLKNFLVVGLILVTGTAFAQTDPAFSPPPMVPANPPPMPAPEPTTTPASTPASTPSAQPGTPPPPSTVPPPGYQPGYSPYGQPPTTQKPGPEVGLMISESLFGMLTAGGITVLPYFLLFGNNMLGDTTVSSILMILIFSAVPLAVAQTQVSLANGSKYYTAEMWPAALAGIGAQAGVLGLFYATGWLGTPQASGGTPSNGGSVALLLIGSIVAVPLIQMAVLNLTKSARFKPYALGDKPGHRLELGLPGVSPIVAETRAGRSIGINLSLLNGTF